MKSIRMIGAVGLIAAGALHAILPAAREGVATKAFRTPGLLPPPSLQLAEVAELASLGVEAGRAYRDTRSGAWGTIVLAQPLLPGAGNSLSWTGLGMTPPSDEDAIADAARAALAAFLADHAAALGVDSAELEPRPLVTVHDGGRDRGPRPGAAGTDRSPA